MEQGAGRSDEETRRNRQRLFELYAGCGPVSLFLRLRWWHAAVPDIERHVPLEGTIVDLGCGHGFMTNYMAICSAARRVIGIELSESRVSQLHARAVAKLRTTLEREDASPSPTPAFRLPQNLPISVFATG